MGPKHTLTPPTHLRGLGPPATHMIYGPVCSCAFMNTVLWYNVILAFSIESDCSAGNTEPRQTLSHWDGWTQFSEF